MLKKVEKFLKEKKKCDIFDHILNNLSVDSENVVSSILAVEKLFCTLFERNELKVDPLLKSTDSKEWESQNEFILWLKENFVVSVKKIGGLLDCNKVPVKNQALVTLMKLFAAEARSSVLDFDNKELLIPLTNLNIVIQHLLSPTSRTSNLIERYKEYIEYQDVLFYTCKVLKDVVSKQKTFNDTAVLNLADLMEHLGSALSNKNLDESELMFYSSTFKFKTNLVHKYINKIWENLLKKHFSAAVHRRLLVVLLERLMPHFHSPLFLTDYLMGCLNLGGAISLLSLQGILILVQKYNMEYPNIYKKLYSLFEPEIFHTKYKSRLFYLANIFLSSTHLQEQLVAAFAKRLARLALLAKVEDTRLMIMFIGNLLIRHPSLRKLIHHPVGDEVSNDPFDMEEPDPVKSKAIDSSLWELKLLTRHVQPSISTAAKFIDSNLPSVEWDLEPFLDETTEHIFEKEVKKKPKELVVNFIRPQSLKQMKDDRVYKLWDLTS